MILKNENRRHFRKSALIIAEYTTSEGTFHGVLKDISAGGLFIRTLSMATIGQRVALEFSLFSFDETLSVTGVVSRIDPDGFGVKFDEPIKRLACTANEFPSLVNEGDR